jgi:zinc protease
MLWYKVGAADEHPGKSGEAHFLEHLMFKGTKTIPPGEFSRIIANNGGRENAFTAEDYTAYYQIVAADRLELMMRIEADRMANLVITDDQLLPERDVILEERRMRIDNVPSSQLHEQISPALYLNHPYRLPTIGWAHEMAKLDTAGETAFYKTWYAPNNAVLVIAGDIATDQVRVLAEKYYGPIPSHPVPDRIRLAEPPHVADAQVTLRSARVRHPSWSREWLAPSYHGGATEHAYALQVLAEVLGGGASSRLHRALVLDKPMATAAGAFYSPTRLDLTSFGVYASPRPGTGIPDLAAAVDEVLAKALADGVSSEEVERAKARMRAEAIYAQDSLQQPAQIFGSALTTGQTVADVDAWPDRIGAVTVEQVRAAAKTVLDGKPAVTGILLPEHTS